MSNAPTIPALLSQAFDLHAERTALVDGDRSITYGELRHAIAVAARHPAIARGSDEDPPPLTIIAPLGVEGTVLQLAAMFAGRMCAPLEVWMPTDQLVESIDVLGGPVICLDPDVARALEERGVATADTDSLRLDALLATPAPNLVGPGSDGDSAAMVLFTSGSTGRPKAVLVPHSLLRQMLAPHTVGTGDVVAITAPPSFIFSVGQTLMALTNGAAGVFADLSRLDSKGYHDVVAATGVTFVSGTTPLLLAMAAHAHAGSLDSVTAVVFASQASTGVEIEELRRTFTDAALIHSYGSTEAGTVTTCLYLPGEPLPGPGPVPAGRALDDVEVMVVDGDDRPVVAGGIGEVTVRLPHPFLGYWRDPEATAAKIMTSSDGREWLRTGDLGRIDMDGTVHLVGRADHLVKIRGRFVNPRDIDSVLDADPRVARVTTVAVPLDVPRELVTFVVAEDPTVTPRELRHHLAQSLPHFALPRRIVLVDTITMNERGKIDRRALAELVPTEESRSTDSPTLSRSNAEESIVQLFREVLDTDVTVHDDFFDVGGDSLAAAELIAVFADEFHIELTPAQLVANPTAAMLLDHLGRRRPGLASVAIVPPDLISLYEGDHPTSLFWVLAGDHGFGTARLSRQTAPLRSWMVREIGTAPGERPLPTLTAIGEHNAGVIGSALTAHTVVIGFSIGSVVALETAAAMDRRGTSPDLLVLIDPPPTEMIESPERAPNPLLRPRTAIRFHRDRWSATHRPWAAADPRDRAGRLIRRSAELARGHHVPDHDGPTVVILTEEYASRGLPSLVDRAVGHHAERIVIPGIHRTTLTRPEGLLGALDRILRERGLL